jgi:hypothetical protein
METSKYGASAPKIPVLRIQNAARKSECTTCDLCDSRSMRAAAESEFQCWRRPSNGDAGRPAAFVRLQMGLSAHA